MEQVLVSAIVEQGKTSHVLSRAERRLTENLELRRQECRRRHWRAYAGSLCLFLAGFGVSYADGAEVFGLSDLRLPLGPMLLAVALTRVMWGKRAAWIGLAPMIAIAALEYAQLIAQGQLPLWGICTVATGVLIANRA
jgi:hypothetical protein